jgi:hypothetical protein
VSDLSNEGPPLGMVLYLGKFFFIFWSITLYLGFKLLRISPDTESVTYTCVVAMVTMQRHFIAQYQVVAAKMITLKVKLIMN